MTVVHVSHAYAHTHTHTHTHTLTHTHMHYYSNLERHSESLSTFASVIEGADVPTQLTLALALYRSNKLNESLQGMLSTLT